MKIKIEYENDGTGYFAMTSVGQQRFMTFAETAALAKEKLLQRVRKWRDTPQPKPEEVEI